MALVIQPTSNQYSLTTSAHRFRQGRRDVYYFALTLETLDGLLPQRVEDDVVRGANRKLTPGHSRNIQAYLDEKDNWLLGAMMLGIAQDAVEFQPYANEDGTVSQNFGEMRIRTNRVNTMRIFDGQHRRRAIQDVLATLSQSEGRADKLDALRKASMTIVLYAEDNIRTLRQMFVDASQTKRIEQHTVTQFDQRDPFNLMAVRLAANSRTFKGRVEMESSSVPPTSQSLLAINQLASILKTTEIGYGRYRGISRDLNRKYMLNQDELYERCRVWADEFLPAARGEFAGLLNGDIKNSDIPSLRSKTFAYSVTFIRVLAGCYHACTIANSESEAWVSLAEFISKAAIECGSGHGLLVDAGMVVTPANNNLFARRQEVQRGINYILDAARDAAAN